MFNMPQMPFQMNGMPFQMPQMPFQMNGMQMPFPFNMFMQTPNASQAEQSKENTDAQNGCAFPFMPFQMPQMPFQMNGMQMPFNFFPMMPNQQADSTQNQNPFAFLNNMMPQKNGMNLMQMLFPIYFMMQSMMPLFMNNGQNQAGQNTIQMQGMNIPVELFQKALQVSASPKALEMLQKVLDTLFDAYINAPGEAPKAE